MPQPNATQKIEGSFAFDSNSSGDEFVLTFEQSVRRMFEYWNFRVSPLPESRSEEIANALFRPAPRPSVLPSSTMEKRDLEGFLLENEHMAMEVVGAFLNTEDIDGEQKDTLHVGLTCATFFNKAFALKPHANELIVSECLDDILRSLATYKKKTMKYLGDGGGSYAHSRKARVYEAASYFLFMKEGTHAESDDALLKYLLSEIYEESLETLYETITTRMIHDTRDEVNKLMTIATNGTHKNFPERVEYYLDGIDCNVEELSERIEFINDVNKIWKSHACYPVRKKMNSYMENKWYLGDEEYNEALSICDGCGIDEMISAMEYGVSIEDVIA